MKIKLIIDTGTWMKLDYLEIYKKRLNVGLIDLLYDNFSIAITPQVLREITYKGIRIFDADRTYVFPVEDNEKYQDIISDGFDEADASLFCILMDDNAFIISEDRPLVSYGRLNEENIMFFVDFLIVLRQINLIDKRSLYRLNDILFESRNISKKKHAKTRKFAQNS